MTQRYKPGTVVLLGYSGGDAQRALVDDRGKLHTEEDGVISATLATTIRTLVVLDPDSFNDLNLGALRRGGFEWLANQIQEQLPEQRPEEPKGFGAVVEVGPHGERYLRTERDIPWMPAGTGEHKWWSELPTPVLVRSVGIPNA